MQGFDKFIQEFEEKEDKEKILEYNCGGHPKIYKDTCKAGIYYKIICPKCLIQTSISENLDELIEIWNTVQVGI